MHNVNYASIKLQNEDVSKLQKRQSHKSLRKYVIVAIILRPADNFTKMKTRFDGLNSLCKDCRRSKDNRLKIASLVEPISFSLVSKVCHKCNVNKASSCFRKTKRSIDGLSYICLECLPKSTWTREKQSEKITDYRLSRLSDQ